jgi:hypothetical protein
MRKIENDCCDCAIGCIDCGRKHVEHTYCDCCGADVGNDGIIIYNGEELCEICFKEFIINKFLGTDNEKRAFLHTVNPISELAEWIDDADSDELLDEVSEYDFEDIVSYLREIGHEIDFKID